MPAPHIVRRYRANKTEVVVFPRKRLKTSGLPSLHMGNRDVAYSDTVKYLGILLHSQLTFGPHIGDKVIKANRLLYHFKILVGQLWGPIQFLTRWILTGIV